MRDGGVHRHPKLRHDSVALGDQPAGRREFPSHRFEPGEVIEDQGLLAAMAPQLVADAFAAGDRVLDRCRSGEGRGGQPAERVRPAALVARALSMLDRPQPRGIGLGRPRLDPMHQRPQPPEPAQSQVVSGVGERRQQGIEALARLAGARLGVDLKAHEQAGHERVRLGRRVVRWPPLRRPRCPGPPRRPAIVRRRPAPRPAPAGGACEPASRRASASSHVRAGRSLPAGRRGSVPRARQTPADRRPSPRGSGSAPRRPARPPDGNGRPARGDSR